MRTIVVFTMALIRPPSRSNGLPRSPCRVLQVQRELRAHVAHDVDGDRSRGVRVVARSSGDREAEGSGVLIEPERSLRGELSLVGEEERCGALPELVHVELAAHIAVPRVVMRGIEQISLREPCGTGVDPS